MAEHSTIEWTDATFNPWIGCQKVSPGCDNCYAEALMDKRFGKVVWDLGAERKRTSPANWRKPLQWEREHEAFALMHGRRRRVFCASLADVFDNAVPPAWRTDLFELIYQTQSLDWLLLTKRIGNVPSMLVGPGMPGRMPSHVWLGATVVNQEEADRDIPKLLAVPASVRFLSIEPMLGPIDLTFIDDGHAHREVPREEWGAVDDDDSPPGLWWNVLTGKRTIMHGGADGEWARTDAAVDWVICGGESGPKARPIHVNWVRSIRDQCADAGVPFLWKQWGEWIDHDQPGVDMLGTADSPLHDWGNCEISVRLGKKAAGRLLDGRTHDGFPEIRP